MGICRAFLMVVRAVTNPRRMLRLEDGDHRGWMSESWLAEHRASDPS